MRHLIMISNRMISARLPAPCSLQRVVVNTGHRLLAHSEVFQLLNTESVGCVRKHVEMRHLIMILLAVGTMQKFA